MHPPSVSSALPTHYDILPPQQHRSEPQPTPLGPPPEQASPTLLWVCIYCAPMQVHIHIFASPPLRSYCTRRLATTILPISTLWHLAYILASCNVNRLNCICSKPYMIPLPTPPSYVFKRFSLRSLSHQLSPYLAKLPNTLPIQASAKGYALPHLPP